MTRRSIAAVAALALMGALTAAPALAAQAEPSLISQSWYWESQQNEDHDTPIGSVTVGAPDPFCPKIPGSLGAPPETCAEGRLPVEVIQGDYEEPDKVSAIAFDLTMLTLGSEVQKFTVTLLEAESGCREKQDADTGQYCEETDARNIEGKQVQACEVTEIFGDGEGREYEEMPSFSCDSPVLATRKEIKNDEKTDPQDPDADHQWTFDLTPLATKWAQTPPLCTCVMLRPAKPKNDQDDSPNWRVVFAGPKFPKGVKTNLRYTPGEGGGLPPLDTLGGDLGGGDLGGGTSSFGSTTVGGGLDSGGGDVGGGFDDAAAGGDAAPAEEAEEAGDAAPTAAKLPEVETMPGYVWLAILAGLIGFSLVRSIVLENIHGQRPNGVLAQIHRINAARGGMHGAQAAAAAGGPLAGLRSGFASIGRTLSPVTSRLSGLAGKLPGIKKG